MTVKYQIEVSGNDIFVLEKGEGYHVTISSRVNPLSFGNKLTEYETLGKAIDAAEKFGAAYALTKEFGYRLEECSFRKDGMDPIPVPDLLDSATTAEELRDMLEQRSELHKTNVTG